MPRRAITSETPDNYVKVKQEKSRNKGKQTTYTPEEDPVDEDAEGEPDEDAPGEQEEEERSPRGSKRIRVNDEEDSHPSSNGHDGSQQAPKMKTLPRDTDGYALFFSAFISIE